MKGLIELSNFAVGTVSSKFTIPSETKGEVEVTQNVWEMYGNSFWIEIFMMIPPYDLNIM